MLLKESLSGLRAYISNAKGLARATKGKDDKYSKMWTAKARNKYKRYKKLGGKTPFDKM